ncbi:hypothetical protein SAMN05444166_4185 [Singulisphaera sp. GP187]|uniref:hypothetical protein n=1 Tax=Singulisphaera sp. GP187 TaxID=1882752 RepID=UPI00092AB994|nr:hypothetical protein [Singulisphaera sp. GP187]SIO37346.1 hypothetical protein SAMN05444166_4185 [Singulisphaera sp. GP187]
MIEFVTKPQLDIVSEARNNFRKWCLGADLTALYRLVGNDVRIELGAVEQEQIFLVRELVPGESSPEDVRDVCSRIMSTLAVSITNYFTTAKRSSDGDGCVGI